MMNLSTNRVFGPGHVRSAPDHQVPHSCHARPRLQQRLAEALTRERSLIVISAPAGFGKTTLLSEWLQHLSLPSAWLSLDAADNDMARFLAYLSAALHKIHPEGAQLRAATPRAASLPETESLLTALVNEINSSARSGVLVLDDYHVIDAPAVHAALAFLVDHLPAQLHLGIHPSLLVPRFHVKDSCTNADRLYPTLL